MPTSRFVEVAELKKKKITAIYQFLSFYSNFPQKSLKYIAFSDIMRILTAFDD